MRLCQSDHPLYQVALIDGTDGTMVHTRSYRDPFIGLASCRVVADTTGTMSRRERIIQMAAKIQSLRGELARLEFQFDAMLQEGGAGANLGLDFSRDMYTHDAPRPGVLDSDASTAQQIVHVLDADEESLFSVDAVAKALGLNNVASVRSTLTRLVTAGKVKRVERGLYQSAGKARPLELPSGPPDDEGEAPPSAPGGDSADE